MATKTQHVIFDDARNLYFKGLPLGMFWECTHDVKYARKFPTRAAAAKVLKANGKNREGWRVLTVAV